MEKEEGREIRQESLDPNGVVFEVPRSRNSGLGRLFDLRPLRPSLWVGIALCRGSRGFARNGDWCSWSSLLACWLLLVLRHVASLPELHALLPFRPDSRIRCRSDLQRTRTFTCLAYRLHESWSNHYRALLCSCLSHLRARAAVAVWTTHSFPSERCAGTSLADRPFCPGFVGTN